MISFQASIKMHSRSRNLNIQSSQFLALD